MSIMAYLLSDVAELVDRADGLAVTTKESSRHVGDWPLQFLSESLGRRTKMRCVETDRVVENRAIYLLDLWSQAGPFRDAFLSFNNALIDLKSSLEKFKNAEIICRSVEKSGLSNDCSKSLVDELIRKPALSVQWFGERLLTRMGSSVDAVGVDTTTLAKLDLLSDESRKFLIALLKIGGDERHVESLDVYKKMGYLEISSAPRKERDALRAVALVSTRGGKGGGAKLTLEGITAAFWLSKSTQNFTDVG